MATPPAPRQGRTGPQPAAPPPGALAPDPRRFDRVPDGYHPGQVDRVILALLERVRAAEERAARAVREAGGALLRGAESPQGQQLIEDVLRTAAAEIEGNRAAALADAEKILADATARGRQSVTEAAREADSLTAGARQQADVVLAGAREEAKRVTDEATARATAVSEVAGRRLEAIAGRHADTLRRLSAIHDLTGQLVAGEEERGPLEDDVDRAVAAAVPPPS